MIFEWKEFFATSNKNDGIDFVVAITQNNIAIMFSWIYNYLHDFRKPAEGAVLKIEIKIGTMCGHHF